MRPVRVLLMLGIVVFAVPAAVLAQSATSADIEGSIKDSTGGGLPGATLVATNVATGVERRSVDRPGRTVPDYGSPCR